ncbi:hypothetical protein [Roseateles sp.]
MTEATPKAARKASPSWREVKTRLVDCDRAGLLGLLQVLAPI